LNTLVQLDSGILGSAEAVASLSAARKAQLLVLSDTHGHYTVVEAIIREFGPACDALLFAGDGMWDFVQYLENAQESDKLTAALPPVVVFVAGNGDGEQYRVTISGSADSSEPEDVPGYSLSIPSRQIVRACGYGIFLVHGHRHAVEVSLEVLVDSAHAMDCDIAVYGHTHIALSEHFSHILALNPGSPSRPRGHTVPGFAVLELDSASTMPKAEFYVVHERQRGGFGFERNPAFF